MIKKLILATIIFLGLLTPVSSFAMELTLPEIYSLGDLGYGLALGAEWDFTGKDDFIIQDISNLTPNEIDAAATMRARHFLEQYAINRGIPYASEGQVYDNPKDYLVSTYFNKTVTSLYQKYQMELEAGNVNADATLRMPISRQRVTDWSGYKIGISQRYLDSYVYGMDIPDTPSANPDPDYISYLDAINGSGFYFSDWPQKTFSGNLQYRYYPFTEYSWYTISTFSPNRDTLHVVCVDPITLNIYGDNDSYTCDSTITNFLYNFPSGGVYYRVCKLQVDSNPNYDKVCVAEDDINTTQNYHKSGTLSSVLTDISLHFKNVNIYVNDEPWSLVSDPAPADPLLPEFPDVINTDYGLIETVDLPATPDNHGTFDITSLFDAIKEAIIGASDNDPTTDGTLAKDGVTDTYRDDTGELTGEEDIPLEDAIEDSFPIEDTLNYPEIILPYEPIHNAFMGTTVLAQLIDATQTVLPEELILVFWGIVFILFIIGLIKILHK